MLKAAAGARAAERVPGHTRLASAVGISGARRNACVAVCVDGEVRSACEQERLTRVRRAGLEPGALPSEAVETVLALAGMRRDDVQAYVVAEQEALMPPGLAPVVLEHHEAHAAAAFLTSPFESAAVLVCDSHAGRELSVWAGKAGQVRDCRWLWSGPAFATLYSQCAALFEPPGPGRERQMEARAHLGHGPHESALLDRLQTVFQYADGRLHADASWRSRVQEMIHQEQNAGGVHPVRTASAVQARLGELLLQVVAEIKEALDVDAICLGGGLFYNTYFTTLIRRSGIFGDVFVPINPGNSGLAVGATLMLAPRANGADQPRPVPTPFLGPEYDDHEIKATLDGCKLSYAFVSESEALDATIDALTRGQLVGWLQGRMEWGPRALGHRSILADPRSPYVLDNLNCFLRKRERWRSFGVSVSAADAGDHFCGPPASPYMEYEYGLRDERLRHVMPAGATSIRVQTVTPESGPFWRLHQRMKQRTGTGVLVNTSLNAFQEPIACAPRDAVRVFYGTGLDVLVMGRFILRK